MRHLAFFLLLAGTGSVSALANPSDGVLTPDMDEHILQEKYHIAPTQEGLVGALRHSDPVVRSFAAFRLASKRYADVAAAVLDALASEHYPGVKIEMAVAAFQLGAEGGKVALKAMCEDASWSPSLRMSAARSMLSVGGESCLTSVLTVLRSSENDQASYMALEMLPRFVHATPAELQEGRDLAATYLRNKFPGFRAAASDFMRATGGFWAAALLHDALAVEQDEAIRAVMTRDLSAIQKSLIGEPSRNAR